MKKRCGTLSVLRAGAVMALICGCATSPDYVSMHVVKGADGDIESISMEHGKSGNGYAHTGIERDVGHFSANRVNLGDAAGDVLVESCNLSRESSRAHTATVQIRNKKNKVVLIKYKVRWFSENGSLVTVPAVMDTWTTIALGPREIQTLTSRLSNEKACYFEMSIQGVQR